MAVDHDWSADAAYEDELDPEKLAEIERTVTRVRAEIRAHQTEEDRASIAEMEARPLIVLDGPEDEDRIKEITRKRDELEAK